MPNGSIPHGQQRPNANKRHDDTRENPPKLDETHNTASDDVEHMSVEELDWQMDRTLRDIMFLTRRYIRQYDERERRTGGVTGSRIPQVIVMHMVGWAHSASTPEEADKLHARMQEAGF